MKALSVRNPFAHFIMCDEKPYEYRTWQTNYRGDLLICSSANPKIKNTICGYALCVVRINDVFEITAKNYHDYEFDKKPDGKMYAWHLTNVRLIKPFPVKGKLNFFDVDDNLIEYLEDSEDLSEEKADFNYKTYIEPLLCK